MTGNALGATGVIVESANDYSPLTGDHSQDTTCNTETVTFRDTLLAGSSPYTHLVSLFDSLATDRTLSDPQSSGTPADLDQNAFDKAGGAISYLCFHGTCGNIVQSGSCTTSSNCPFGYCANTPPSAYASRCVNNTGRQIVTASAIQSHGNFITYPGNLLRWGESPTAGSWGGAGTNGGSNLFFITNSCGLAAPYWTPATSIAAGAHVILGILPHGNNTGWWADTMTHPDRGTVMATYALANLNGRPKDAWFATLASLSQNSGGACPDGGSTYTYGGGRGINGCGAHWAVSRDNTQALANWHVDTQSFYGAMSDSNDAKGGGYSAVRYYCNYDCSLYPFTK